VWGCLSREAAKLERGDERVLFRNFSGASDPEDLERLAEREREY
jgi:hypothetical protein